MTAQLGFSMAKYFILVILIALMLGGYFTYRVAEDPSRFIPTAEEGLTGRGEEAFQLEEYQQWQSFTPSNRKFNISFPVMPQEATEYIRDKNTGESRKYDMYVAEKNDGTILMISLVTFDHAGAAAEKERIKREMMNDMIASNPSYILKTVDQEVFKGYDALNFSYGNEELEVEAKSFFVGNTLFLLSEISKPTSRSTRDFPFFLHSLELSKDSEQPSNTK